MRLLCDGFSYEKDRVAESLSCTDLEAYLACSRDRVGALCVMSSIFPHSGNGKLVTNDKLAIPSDKFVGIVREKNRNNALKYCTSFIFRYVHQIVTTLHTAPANPSPCLVAGIVN